MGGDPDTTVKDTPEQKALAKVSASKYNYYEQELLPVRNSWIEDMRENNDESKFTQLSGDVAIGNSEIFAGQQSEAMEALNSNNINPNSARYKATMGKVVDDQAKVGADVLNRAQSIQQDNYVAGLSSVVALGEGRSAEAIQGMSDLASSANEQARADTKSKLNNNMMLTEAGAGLAGYAYSDYRSNNDDGD